MSPSLDGQLYTAAALLSGLLGTAGTWVWLRRDRRLGLLWRFAATLLLLLAVATWIHRWILVGHLPLFGTYESALSLATAVLAVAWLKEWRAGFALGLGPLAALVAAVLLLHGRLFNATGYALTISERSLVVDLHAVFAWLAFGVLTANAALALVSLVRRRDFTPSLVTTLKQGFALHSGMMASGSLYKFMLFGKAWSFDPMELLGFIAWIAYGTLVHLAVLGGWRCPRLARWCVFVFVLLLASYRLIVYFPAWSTYHILDVDLRIHLPG